MSASDVADPLEAVFATHAAAIVDDAVTAELAAELRARFAGIGYARYRLLDRGSYDRCDPASDASLCAILVGLAARATGRPSGAALAVRELHALRLRTGDYLLAHHDPLRDDRPVEVVLDISAEPTPGAELHYRRRGQVFLRVPSAPCIAAIVDRGPTVSCNHVYVSARHPRAEIVRIMAVLSAASRR